MRLNFRKTVRISKLQSKHRMVGQAFNPGGCDKGRTPWLSGYWFGVSNFESKEDMNSQRQKYIDSLNQT